MYRNPVAIAAAVLLLSSAVSAEPVAPVKAETAAPARPATTLFAQASEVKLPVMKDDPAAAPAKPRRAARVTTCRCADVVAQQN
jgi:hypothetical protein